MAFGGRVAVWRANDSGQKCRLTWLDFADVLAEICLGRFAETSNREAAAIAEINVVGVELENLLLRKALVRFPPPSDFLYLAAPFALGGKEKRPRHLHVDRAGALRFSRRAERLKSRAENANQVQRAVIEKSLILGGQHRVDHHRGNSS